MKVLVWILCIFGGSAIITLITYSYGSISPILSTIIAVLVGVTASKICKNIDKKSNIKQENNSDYTENNIEATTSKITNTEENKTMNFYDNSNLDKLIASNNARNNAVRSITKKQAIELCHKNGVYLTPYVTFASANSSNRIYWANPSTDLLKVNWTIILNDNINHKIHVFKIPKDSISVWDVKTRNDNGLIDLQISFYDLNFQDTRSGICFGKWLITSLNY